MVTATPQPPPKRRRGWVIALVALLIVAVVGGLVAAVIAFSSDQNATAPTPTTAAPTPQLLFQDSLTSNTNGWYTGSVDGGSCTFAADGYHITNNAICLAPAGALTNFNATVQVTQIKGPLTYAHGLMFRSPVSDRLDGYAFEIDGQGYWAFFKFVKGEPTRLHDFTSNAAIAHGLNATNTLQVVAKGSHFTFYVNGVQVGSFNDTTFASGEVGLDSGKGIEVVYRNLKISAVS